MELIYLDQLWALGLCSLKRLHSVKKKTTGNCSCQKFAASTLLLYVEKFKECATLRRLTVQQTSNYR